jgi:hypothetical protein
MLFSPTMETRKSKNPELRALLPKNMHITKNGSNYYLENYVYMYNTISGDFLDKSISIRLYDGNSISKVKDELLKRVAVHIKQTITLPGVVLDDLDNTEWFKKVINPLIHKDTIKGISITRRYGGVFIYINHVNVSKHLGLRKQISCSNIFDLENAIGQAVEIIKSVEQPVIPTTILIEDRIYIKNGSNGSPGITCSITINMSSKKQYLSKFTSLNKYSFSEALSIVRTFRDETIKKYNLRPARPLTKVDIFNIEHLKAKYDNLKPEQP